MGITTDIDEKVLSELKLMAQVGATPVECVEALKGKMSRSSVYKYHNRFKAVDNAKEEKAVNIPSEVVKEPVSKNKEADGIYQDGQVIDFNGKKIKFVYTGTTSIDECYKCCLEEECCDCMDIGGYWIDAEIKKEVVKGKAEIIDEIATKNEELQKELHTQKVVIETLQKGVNELNETVTESKIMIAEIAKERDDKDEEIRVLNLELQKYKNDIKMVIDDRQKLECLLSDNANETGSIADFREIIEEMIQLYTRKNKDYGNAFKQSYGEFGNVMCAIRINDKLNRFKTLIKQNNEVKTESIKDTLIDLANYAVMTIIEIERGKN